MGLQWGCSAQQLAEQHGGAGDDRRDRQVQHRGKATLEEHGFPRFDVGYALHPLNAPELAVGDPQPVQDDAVEPVHDQKKEIRLPVGGLEIGDAVPDGQNQHEHDDQNQAERDHAELAPF